MIYNLHYLLEFDCKVKRGAGWRDRDDWGWSVLHEAAAAGQQPGQVNPGEMFLYITARR